MRNVLAGAHGHIQGALDHLNAFSGEIAGQPPILISDIDVGQSVTRMISLLEIAEEYMDIVRELYTEGDTVCPECAEQVHRLHDLSAKAHGAMQTGQRDKLIDSIFGEAAPAPSEAAPAPAPNAAALLGKLLAGAMLARAVTAAATEVEKQDADVEQTPQEAQSKSAATSAGIDAQVEELKRKATEAADASELDQALAELPESLRKFIQTMRDAGAEVTVTRHKI